MKNQKTIIVVLTAACLALLCTFGYAEQKPRKFDNSKQIIRTNPSEHVSTVPAIIPRTVDRNNQPPTIDRNNQPPTIDRNNPPRTSDHNIPSGTLGCNSPPLNFKNIKSPALNPGRGP